MSNNLSNHVSSKNGYPLGEVAKEAHLDSRPPKRIFPPDIQIQLRNKAIAEIKERLLSDSGIIRVVLMGSSVKGTFGKYEPPGFRGSIYSDFDFIVFVEDDYEIPGWLEREPDGKPFPDDAMNLAYKCRKLVENKFDAEVFFIRKSDMDVPKVQKLGEEAGIPMTVESEHPHIVLFEKCIAYARGQKAKGVVTETAFENEPMQKLCESF